MCYFVFKDWRDVYIFYIEGFVNSEGLISLGGLVFRESMLSLFLSFIC